MTLFTVRVVLLEIAPPGLFLWALAMVSPEMLTVPVLTVNTPYWLFPEIVNELAPGPVIVKSSAIAGNGPASIIVPVSAMLMVSPGIAELRAARSDPVAGLDVLSLKLVTISVVAEAVVASRTTAVAHRMRSNHCGL